MLLQTSVEVFHLFFSIIELNLGSSEETKEELLGFVVPLPEGEGKEALMLVVGQGRKGVQCHRHWESWSWAGQPRQWGGGRGRGRQGSGMVTPLPRHGKTGHKVEIWEKVGKATPRVGVFQGLWLREGHTGKGT